MDSNFSFLPQSYKTAGQAPLDAKTIANSLDALLDLGQDDFLTTIYYRGLRIYCQENGKTYEWTDFLSPGQTKLLPQDYVYGENAVYDGVSYANKAFNFVEVHTQYKEQNSAEIKSVGAGIPIYIGIDPDSGFSEIASIQSDDFQISTSPDGKSVIINAKEDGGIVVSQERFAVTESVQQTPTVLDDFALDPVGWYRVIPSVSASTDIVWKIQSVMDIHTKELVEPWSEPVILSSIPGEPGKDGVSYSIVSDNTLETVSVGTNHILDVARSFDIVPIVYKNGEVLTATNSLSPTASQYRLEIPTGLASGITASKPLANTIRISVASGTALTETIMVFIKAFVGADGAFVTTPFYIVPISTAEDTYSLSLSSNTLIVKYDQEGQIINQEDVVLSVVQQNYEEEVTWTTQPEIASLHNTTGLSKTIDPATLMGANNLVKIRVSTANGLYDEVSIVRVVDGKDGAELYIWKKYSLYENGRDSQGNVSMSDDSFVMIEGRKEDMVYMGLSLNQTNPIPSNIPEDYDWAKIKGNDGHTGYILELSNDNTSVPSSSTGIVSNPSVAFANAKTNVALYYGNDIEPEANYEIVLTASPGVTYTTNAAKTSLQLTGLTSDTAAILFTAYGKTNGVIDMEKPLASATFSVTKVKNTAVHEIIPSTTVIKVDGSGVVTPSTISAKVLINTGDTNSYINAGNLTYLYLFNNNIDSEDDGTPLAIDEDLVISNTGNPQFLEFKYFHPTTGELVDRERVPFVKDGANGVSATREETRFQKTASFSVVPTVVKTQADPEGWSLLPPVVNATEIVWVIKSVKNSSNALVTQWSDPSRYSGPAGPKGDSVKGDTGPSLSILPKGPWDASKSYKGSASVIEAVSYNGSWYVTRVDAGTIPIGMLPTNTDYWNASQHNFEFIATGLFLAETAYIDNLGVRYVQTATSGTRLEINGATNELNFYKEGSEDPKVKIGTFSYNFGDTLGYTGAGIMVDYKAWLTEQGVRSLGSEVGFYEDVLRNPTTGEPISLPFKTSVASIFGRTTKAAVASQGENDNKINAGVAGTSATPAHYGRLFGGYFDALLVGSESFRVSKQNTLTAERSTYYYTGTSSISVSLPSLATVSAGWNTHSVFKALVINTKTGTINVSGNGQTFTITGKGKAEFYWDGVEWVMFKVS